MNKITKLDIIITVAVFAGAIILLVLQSVPMTFVKNGEKSVLILSEDGVNSEYPLDVDREVYIESNGYHLTVVICDGAAFVSDSDCENKICMTSGKISRAGQSVVCAPARVSLYIKTQNGSGADAYAG